MLKFIEMVIICNETLLTIVMFLDLKTLLLFTLLRITLKLARQTKTKKKKSIFFPPFLDTLQNRLPFFHQLSQILKCDKGSMGEWLYCFVLSSTVHDK